LFRADTSRFCELAFTGLFGAKITDREAHDVLDGKLPDGSEIPVYPFDEFNRGIPDLPRHYAVVMDFNMAKQGINGYQAFDELKNDPLTVVRAGGAAAAVAYLDKVRERNNTSVMGNWHPFNSFDARQAQTRVPLLAGNRGGVGSEEEDGHLYGYDAEYGMGGDSSIHNTSMINVARFLAVAPRNESTSVRNLSFRA
jgi:CheY-like chemotaxis protein